MNSDRELLELAARAAGVKLHPMEIITHEREVEFVGFMTDPAQWPRGWWNPLTNPGDALRLAVKLNINIMQDHGDGTRLAQWDDPNDETRPIWIQEDNGTDPCVATCRAITRAAAERAHRSTCQAVQYGDQASCPCGVKWDANDPQPPDCRARNQIKEGNNREN